MGHGGPKVRLGLIGAGGLGGQLGELAVEAPHHHHVEHEQQHGRRHDADQEPVHAAAPERAHADHRQYCPAIGDIDRRMGHQTFLALGAEHRQRTGLPGQGRLEALLTGGIRPVAGLVELKEVGALKGFALDDVIARAVDHGDLRVGVFIGGEDPFVLDGLNGHHAHHHGPAPLGQRDGIVERDGRDAVDGVGVGASDVDGGVCAVVVEELDVLVGDGTVPGIVGPGVGGKARHGGIIGIDDLAHDPRRGHRVSQEIHGPFEGGGGFG